MGASIFDIVIPVGRPNQIYQNNGTTLVDCACLSAPDSRATVSVVWGDYDGDGDLDLAAGNVGIGIPFTPDGGNRIYENDNGAFMVDWEADASQEDVTLSVAWGDYDGDGDLDLAVGNASIDAGQPNKLYQNDAGTLQTTPVWSSNRG